MWVAFEPDEGHYIVLDTYKECLERVQDNEVSMWVFEINPNTQNNGLAEWCEYEEMEDD